jgi:hypothetical protein
MFLSCVGLTELVRYFILSLFYDKYSFTPFIVLNVGIISSFLAAYLRVWIARTIGTILFDHDFINFVYLQLTFGSQFLIAASLVGYFIFGAFRRVRWIVIPVQFLGPSWAAYAFARGIGLPFLTISRPNHMTWFRVVTDKPSSSFSFVGFLLYGIGGVFILRPMGKLVVDWLYGESPFDATCILLHGIVFTAYAAFFGLWKTIHRLRTAKSSWHDDHIRMQFFPSLGLMIGMAVYVFWVKKLYVFDILGMVYSGITIFATGVVAISWGTFGSYLPSLLFVYFVIVKPHYVHTEIPQFN